MSVMRQVRKSHSMTLSELAFRSGVDDSVLSKAERGWKRISGEARKRVAETLGVKESDLFEESGYARKN